MLSDALRQIVDNIFSGEEALTHSERLNRGKLARKLGDKTAGSLKGYSKEELDVLNACLVKANAQPTLIEQVEAITGSTTIASPAPGAESDVA